MIEELPEPALLTVLGQTWQLLQEPQQALACHEEALEVQRENYGPQHPEVAEGLLLVGKLYGQLGRQEDATRNLKEALSMLRSFIGPSEHPTVAKILYQLALAAYAAGRKAEALQLFHDCLPMLQRCFGPQDSLVSGAYTYIKDMQSDVPTPTSHGTLAAHDPLGRKGSHAGDEMMELWELLEACEFVRAVPLFAQLLQSQKAEFGEVSAEHAIALMQCGHNCQHAESYEQAAGYFQAAAAVMKQVYSPTHLYVADALNATGDALGEAGKYQEAVAEFEEAIVLLAGSSASPTVMCAAWERLARFHFRFAKLGKALQVWRQVLEMRVTESGEDSPLTQGVHAEMQKVYDEVDRMEEKRIQLE